MKKTKENGVVPKLLFDKCMNFPCYCNTTCLIIIPNDPTSIKQAVLFPVGLYVSVITLEPNEIES